MSSQPEPEKMSLSRRLIGLGFFLLFLAVGIGAAMKETGDFPKYLAAAALSILAGGIVGAIQGWTHRAH